MDVGNMKRIWSEEVENTEGITDTEKPNNNSRDNLSSRKKPKQNNSGTKQSKTSRKLMELETDPDTLQRRQKQIDYGKNTTGYHNYIQQVPVDQRTKHQPQTPDKYTKYSRRSWDTLIKVWRKQLHQYDTDDDDCKDSIVSGSSGE